MPSYTYNCPKCGEFDVEMRMSEYKPIDKCPKCQSNVERVFKPISSVWNCEGSYKGGNNARN